MLPTHLRDSLVILDGEARMAEAACDVWLRNVSSTDLKKKQNKTLSIEVHFLYPLSKLRMFLRQVSLSA